MPLQDLTGKSALITGASSGLGLHFARCLASRGAAVILAARRVDVLTHICDQIREGGGQAQPVGMDVTDRSSIESTMTQFDANIDILVNSAGIVSSGRAIDMSEADWDGVVDTNLKGAFMIAQTVARRMKKAGHGGAIVNISSILGLRVAGNVCAYAASKAGLIQLTKSLALEWARDGIRVNALCPGYVETELNRTFFGTDAGLQLIKRIPQRRLGKLEDLDGAFLLLCSDAGRYITGSTIVVDGGHLISSL